MSAVNKNRIGDDDVYEAVTRVDGGQLVIPQAGATNPDVQGIQPAGDAAKNCLGVAFRTAIPLADQGLSGTTPDGYPETYVSPTNELTTVFKHCVTDVQYTAAAVGFGAKLAAAAAGKVRAWVAADGADAVVGECRVVGGMAAAGGWGKALIH